MGCGLRTNSGDLVRIRAEGDEPRIGPGTGRGAWVGPSRVCLERAVQRGTLARGLRVEANATGIARLLESWPTDPPSCPYEGG